MVLRLRLSAKGLTLFVGLLMLVGVLRCSAQTDECVHEVRIDSIGFSCCTEFDIPPLNYDSKAVKYTSRFSQPASEQFAKLGATSSGGMRLTHFIHVAEVPPFEDLCQLYSSTPKTQRDWQWHQVDSDTRIGRGFLTSGTDENQSESQVVNEEIMIQHGNQFLMIELTYESTNDSVGWSPVRWESLQFSGGKIQPDIAERLVYLEQAVMKGAQEGNLPEQVEMNLEDMLQMEGVSAADTLEYKMFQGLIERWRQTTEENLMLAMRATENADRYWTLLQRLDMGVPQRGWALMIAVEQDGKVETPAGFLILEGPEGLQVARGINL